MRNLSFSRALGVCASAVLLASGIACSAGGGEEHAARAGSGNTAGSGNSSGGSDSSSTAGSGNASGSGGMSTIGITTLLKTCDSSALGAPQLRRLTPGELQRSLDDIFPQLKGKWAVSIADAESPLGFDNDPAVLTVGGQVAGKLLDTATALATALVADDVLPQVLPCAGSAPNRTCAQTFLDQFGRRLFRRPLSQADQDRYLSFFDARLAASDFKSALRWLTIGLIQSPHAIYRREIGTLSGSEYQLTPYEIASELAYMYSGTTPTPELLAKADAGQLDSPEHLSEIAGQLLATPAGQDMLQRFFKGWLSYDQIPSTLPNVSGFAAVAPDMVKETQAFIQQVVISDRGGPRELLTASYTTPSQALASFYNLPAPSADFAKVQRPEGRGLGVLAQGSLIAAHSHEAASSPTLRGLVVFEKLLCGQRPQVPASVPTLVPASPGVKTTRQRYEDQHMAAGSTCRTCHRLFDPLGFGFEHYDEAGRYRDQEVGLPIDSSGSLTDGNTELFKFSGLDELAKNLSQQDKVAICSSGYVNAYAFANAVACLGETRRGDFVAGKLGFIDYFASLAAEPSLSRRK
ncbi:MAG TPA: DUF1588 domain-containing protein [Polyangiaceae bacterium]|nr:DUF1588 domain-containing protein [Polyangiaceae bacterium]